MKTRYKKVIRDLTGDYSKTLMLVLAIAAGIFGIGTLLGGYSVIKREMKDNYMGSLPASATIEVGDTIPAGLIKEVEKLPGIRIAERHATISARMKVDDLWRPLLLFVIDDFKGKQTNRFAFVSGETDPPTGSMLVERSSLAILESQEEDGILVKTPHSTPQKIKISGIVHDPSLAPAWQEEGGYGYITLSTLHGLGEIQGFDQLRLLVDDSQDSEKHIIETASMVAAWLETKGYSVHEIQIPPPGQHPHQSQMNAVMSIFVVFAFMILILGSILISTSLATIMVKQVRQIGIMKTIGARSSQVIELYFIMIIMICLAALLLGIPLSRWAAEGFYKQIAWLLNLEIRNPTIEHWVPWTQIGTGILIPLVFAAFPVVKGGRASVRQAMDNYGVHQKEHRSRGWLLSWPLFSFNELFQLSVRNVFRHRVRLVMTLGLLAAGGAMFMTALNVSEAWKANLDRIYSQRLYDIEVSFNDAVAEKTVYRSFKHLPRFENAEGLSLVSTSFVAENDYEITHTYPDQGHGSFTMQAVPIPTKMMVPEVAEGRWLQMFDSNAVVLNQLARSLQPELKLGDMILLSMDGKSTEWMVVGFTEDVGTPATAYVSLSTFQKLMESTGKINMVRIAYANRSRENISTITPLVEGALEKTGISVKRTVPVWLLHNAVASHIEVMVNSLLAMAALMGLVGIIGLASTISMNIMERTREIGVMRTIGATPKIIRKLVIGEGFIIGILSIFLAFIISLFISAQMGIFIGNLAFKTPLALTISPFAFVGWVFIVIAGSYVAAYFPAKRANKITAREALAYE